MAIAKVTQGSTLAEKILEALGVTFSSPPTIFAAHLAMGPAEIAALKVRVAVTEADRVAAACAEAGVIVRVEPVTYLDAGKRRRARRGARQRGRRGG